MNLLQIKVRWEGVMLVMSSWRFKFSALRIAVLAAVLSAVLLVASSGPAWCADEKPEVFVQLGHSDRVVTLATSPDGRYVLSGSEDKSVKLWETATGKEVRTFKFEEEVNNVIFSPDGNSFLVGCNGRPLERWDLNQGRLLRKFEGKVDRHIESFIEGGSRVIGVSNQFESLEGPPYERIRRTIAIWDATSGEVVKSFVTPYESDDPQQPHIDGSLYAVVASPDGRYVAFAGGEKGVKADVRIWDLEKGREVHRFPGHRSVRSLAFSPDGRFLLSGGNDDNNAPLVILWDLVEEREIWRFHDSSDRFVTSVAFSPDGKSIFTSSHDTVRLDTATGRETSRYKKSDCFDSTTAFAMVPGGERFITANNRNLTLWDVASGKAVQEYSGNAASVDSVAFSNTSHELLIGVDFEPFMLWNLTNGSIRRFTKETGISPRGKFIPSSAQVLGQDRGDLLSIWDAASGGFVRSFEKSHTETIKATAISPDGKYAASAGGRYGNDTEVRLWDLQTGKEITRLAGHTDSVYSLAFSPDSRYLVSGGAGTQRHYFVMMWEVPSGNEVWRYDWEKPQVQAVAFSPNGKYVASGNFSPYRGVNETTNNIALHDARTGSLIKEMKHEYVNSLCFSPDGRFLLSGGKDQVVRLWNVSKGKEVRTFKTGVDVINSVAYSPDGGLVAMSAEGGVVRIWEAASGKEVAMLTTFKDKEWIVTTPEGYFDASPNGASHLNVRIGNNVYSIDQYREALYRPDMVKLALSGGSLNEYRNIADIRQPPRVAIVDTTEKTDRDEASVTVKLVDNGGGIGDVRLYLNGSGVILDNGRGVQVVSRKEDNAVYKTYTLKLTNGKNTVKAVAFNADNTMQSSEAVHEILASSASQRKPALHALVIGIQEFKNPKLALKYATSDADLFADTLQKAAGGLFDTVRITKLTRMEQTTKEGIISTFKSFQSLNPDDLFIFYVASHGTADDGDYFLITSNVGSTSTRRLQTDALSKAELMGLLANVPSTKKMAVIDTCNAGAIGDTVQTAMLTRGMSDDTAMKILSRAVGTTMLYASNSVQEALEGYNGHGLFTWVVAEGLKGKATKERNGYVKTTDLANYVEDEVPNLAEKIYKKAQYPTVSISGQGFPIGKVQ